MNSLKSSLENNLVVSVRIRSKRDSSNILNVLSELKYDSIFIAAPCAPRCSWDAYVFFELNEPEDLLLLLRKIKFADPRREALLVLEGIELLTGEHRLCREILHTLRELSNVGILSVLWILYEGDKEFEPEIFDLSLRSVDILP